MKELQLRKLISEEIRMLLSERFGSKRLQSLVSNMGKYEKRAFLKGGVAIGLTLLNHLDTVGLTKLKKVK